MELIKLMQTGDKKVIKNALFHQGAYYRANAISYAARIQYSDPMIVQRIKELKKDNTCLFGHNAGPSISDFAKAYLDLLNIEKYEGTREEVKTLIEIKLAY